jgi:hypothetical protein
MICLGLPNLCLVFLHLLRRRQNEASGRERVDLNHTPLPYQGVDATAQVVIFTL